MYLCDEEWSSPRRSRAGMKEEEEEEDVDVWPIKYTGDLHSACLRYINHCPWVCTLDHSATLTTDLTTVLPTATMRQVSQVLIVRTRKCYNHCVCGNAFDRYTPCYLTPRCLSTWRRAICSPHQACDISKQDRGSWRGSHWPFVWRSASMHG